MIHIYEDAPNISAKEFVLEPLTNYYDEVRQMLVELPETVNIWLDNQHLIDETGTGGFAYGPDIINVSFDIDFPDKVAQLHDLRATIFHEGYHLVQGRTYEDPKALYKTALDAVIYEGCATVFEREYAGVNPLWGIYDQHDETLLSQWRDELSETPYETYIDPDAGLWDKWSFYDDESSQRWRAYKVGTWIVDQFLAKTGKDVLDLRRLTTEEVLSFL